MFCCVTWFKSYIGLMVSISGVGLWKNNIGPVIGFISAIKIGLSDIEEKCYRPSSKLHTRTIDDRHYIIIWKNWLKTGPTQQLSRSGWTGERLKKFKNFDFKCNRLIRIHSVIICSWFTHTRSTAAA